MKRYYWTEDTFGPELPEDWEEMMRDANNAIDAVISVNGLDPEEDEDEIMRYSNRLFEYWCVDGMWPEMLRAY